MISNPEIQHFPQTSGRWLVCAVAAMALPLQALAAETVLHSFASPPRGANPQAGVIRDTAGNLYGTTYNGGTSGAGVVYKVNTSGQLIVLYNFTGGADGANPWGGVVRDSAGNLYGTTYYGGSGSGVVFKIDTTNHETVLHTFTGGADGGYQKAASSSMRAGISMALPNWGASPTAASFTN